MGEVIQLQGDQRKDMMEFLVDQKEGLELDPKGIKVLENHVHPLAKVSLIWGFFLADPWVLEVSHLASLCASRAVQADGTNRGGAELHLCRLCTIYRHFLGNNHHQRSCSKLGGTSPAC